MKRISSLVLSFVLLFTSLVFTGCSKEETELNNLIKEVSNLQGYEATGNINLKLNLNAENENTLDEDQKALIEQLKDLNISYKASYIKETGKFRILLYMKDSITKQDTQIADIIYDKEVVYIQVDKIWEFAKKSMTDELLKQRIDTVLKDTKYIKITAEDLKRLSNNSSSFQEFLTGFNKGLTNGLNKDQQELILNFYDKLLKVYDGFTTGDVTKSGTNYVFSVDVNKLFDLIYNFSIYTLDNTEKLADVIKTFVKETDQTKLENIVNGSLSEENKVTVDKDEVIKSIDSAVAEIVKNRDSYKLMLASAMASDEIKQAKGSLEGSKIEFSLGKTDAKTYVEQQTYLIKMKDPEDITKTLFNFELGLNDTVKVVSDFEIVYPTEKVVTISEIENRTNALPTIFSINITSGEYTNYKGVDSENSYLDYLVEQNSTYVPLRAIGEKLGENVNWDAKRKVPYVIQNGNNIDVKGIIKEGTTYVKVRDFEKLGYKVEYNATTHTATVSK